MLALVSFIVVILFSLITVRIGSIALESTGLSKDIARFQAQSAFSGVGFTTTESESLMNNAIRRKILRFLMLMGSAGLTSAVATLILTFVNARGMVDLMILRVSSVVFSVSMIMITLLIVYVISQTKSFDTFIRWVLKKPLHLVKARMDLYDYDMILGLSEGNSIVSFDITKKHWMENKLIGDLKLEKEGVIILGVFRRVHGHEQYIASPSDEFRIQHKDRVVVYTKDDIAQNLATRESG